MHHLVQDFDTLFVSDLIKGFSVERNVVVHVVNAGVVAYVIVCILICSNV